MKKLADLVFSASEEKRLMGDMSRICVPIVYTRYYSKRNAWFNFYIYSLLTADN